jgi:hypothetical protein
VSTLNVNKIADASGGVLAPISSVMRNRIINGAMVIDQRNNGASVTPANSAVTYTLDRWGFFVNQASKLTVQQNSGAVTPPVGFTNYLGVVSSSAYSVGSTDRFLMYQGLEGFNTADLGWGTANAKTVTLSFWVRSSLTGTFGGSLQNSGSSRCYVFSYSIPVANTWTQISITILGDTTGTWLTTNGAGIQLVFSYGTGSTYLNTAGSWYGSLFDGATGQTNLVGTNGATFYITGVQLEVGTQATSFEYRQYGTELALCQRYYQTSFNWAGYCNNAGTSVGGLVYGSQFMRVVPSVGLNGAFNITDTYTADYQQSSASISGTIGGSLNSYFVFMGNFTGLVSTRGYIARMNPSVAYNPITLSAEL